MKIKRLEISGFKSFADRMVFAFDEDITGVVGPNGCGKSNVCDAIRWVMGEQSAKHLRGREMQDVIFAGSESREATSMAEVTLTFDNKDGEGTPEVAAYPEIAVTRRLFRTGESEYYINKTPCRLKDITDLFLGTGVGTKAYSIVEQGRIGFIVSSRPQDRRHLIEEAAGITKYQSRKKAAERKMELTRQNLLRVGDIVAEIQKNLSSLKYQAQKAERFKNYRAEIRDHELHIASHRYLEIVALGKVCTQQHADADEQRERVEQRQTMLETEIETRRVELAGLDAELDRRQATGYELDNRARLADSEVEHMRQDLASIAQREREAEGEICALDEQQNTLRDESERLVAEISALTEEERIEAERLGAAAERLGQAQATEAGIEARNDGWKRAQATAAARHAAAESAIKSLGRRCEESDERLRRIRSEREGLESRLVEVEAQIAAFTSQLDSLRAARSSLGLRRSDVEERLELRKVQIAESDRVLEAVKDELGRKRSRLHALEEMLARYDGASRGVRALMQPSGEPALERIGPCRLVADVFEVPTELEPPMAAVLGARIQHVVVPGVAEGLAAIQVLREQGLGRANVIPAEPRAIAEPDRPVPELPGVRGMLIDQVRYARADERLARLLIGGAIVVDDLATALDLWQRGEGGRDIVTLEGELVSASGALAGGGREEAAEGLLHAMHEVRELGREVDALETQHARQAASHAALKAEIHELSAALDVLRHDAHKGDLDIVTEEQGIRRALEERERTLSRIEALGAEACEVAGAMAEAALELKNADSMATRSGQERAELGQMLESGARELELAREATRCYSAELTESKVRAAAAFEKAAARRSAAGRVQQTLEELGQRRGRLEEEIARGALRQSETAARLLQTQEELALLVTQAELAHSAVSEARGACEATRLQLGEHENSLRTVRARLDEVRQALSRLEISMREREVHVTHLLEQVDERYRLSLPKVLGDYHMREAPSDAIRERLAELTRLVERMGEINLTAIQEHAEQSKRLEFLSGQKADLESALAQLETAITKMNRESRKLFRETFDAVNQKFQELFPRLFRGGRARLELTDPNDMLETGVEIFAQPPGKKLASIELMSGGEKAMTAVALIFAMFQVRPSPFCLLDEVDAPLDEANVGRFIELIREMTDRSQFILITHSKRTMEKTDVLYGVTMQEPGISKLVSVRMREAAPPAVAA